MELPDSGPRPAVTVGACFAAAGEAVAGEADVVIAAAAVADAATAAAAASSVVIVMHSPVVIVMHSPPIGVGGAAKGASAGADTDGICALSIVLILGGVELEKYCG